MVLLSNELNTMLYKRLTAAGWKAGVAGTMDPTPARPRVPSFWAVWKLRGLQCPQRTHPSVWEGKNCHCHVYGRQSRGSKGSRICLRFVCGEVRMQREYLPECAGPYAAAGTGGGIQKQTAHSLRLAQPWANATASHSRCCDPFHNSLGEAFKSANSEGSQRGRDLPKFMERRRSLESA